MTDNLMRAGEPPAACLNVRGLTIIARATGKILVEDVSFSVPAGEAVALIGESGSGKSLTALAVLGLLPSSVEMISGSVLLDGIDITGLRGSASELRGREIAVIFQDPQSCLDPRWTIGRYLTGQFRRLRNLGTRSATAEAHAMLERVGLANPKRIMGCYPHELSGGMAQRVMIAGALAGGPRILIADEPTTALDVTTQAQILDLLADLRSQNDLALLMITHDLGVVADTSDRMLVLYGGRVMEAGCTGLLMEAPSHPYTRALLAAMPDIETSTPPQPISGTPGRPEEDDCCPFHLRCDFAAAACRDTSPVFRTTPDGRRGSACHLETGDHLEQRLAAHRGQG